MSELNEALEALAGEIAGTRALLIMETSGLAVATWGEADFEAVAAEMAEMWKQTREAETVSASGSVEALQLVASKRRWIVIPVSEEYLLTLAMDAGPTAAEKPLDIAAISRRIRGRLRGTDDEGASPDEGAVAPPEPFEPERARPEDPWEVSPESSVRPSAVPPPKERRGPPTPLVGGALAVALLGLGWLLWSQGAAGPRPAPSSASPSAARPAPSGESEVRRLTAVLNQMPGIAVSSTWTPGGVLVAGTVARQEDLGKLKAAFAQVPNVSSVRFAVEKLGDLPIGERVYFPYASAQMSRSEVEKKILPIKAYLDRHPGTKLRVIGHTDPIGTEEANRQIALGRATAVRDVLAARGAPGGSLLTEAVAKPPPDVDALQPLWRSRCVRFEPVAP